MKVAVVGSRIPLIEEEPPEVNWPMLVLRWEVRTEIFALVESLPPDTVIISGGANGPDSYAEKAARKFLKRAPLIYRANWKEQGNNAGFRRNQQIAEDCDELHAWWDGQSRGTQHTIRLARKIGRIVTIHNIVLPMRILNTA